MSPQDFEIIVVDDGSTDDYTKLFKKSGLNIKHIKIDHTKHYLYPEMQQLSEDGSEYWYHTPALSINIGLKYAQGDVVCITQPEVIHAPNNFINGYNLANSGYEQVFGEVIMASRSFNEYLDKTPNWLAKDFDSLLLKSEVGVDYVFGPDEYYWFIEFIPRAAALEIGGVDEQFLRGVFGEDDDFRRRGRLAVRGESYRKRCNLINGWQSNIVGIHQSHKDENHQKQQRDSKFWNDGAERNRNRFYRETTPNVANIGHEWGDLHCVKGINDYFCSN
jgi:glycosyltransferase involved in cell wall biosynthesis